MNKRKELVGCLSSSSLAAGLKIHPQRHLFGHHYSSENQHAGVCQEQCDHLHIHAMACFDCSTCGEQQSFDVTKRHPVYSTSAEELRAFVSVLVQRITPCSLLFVCSPGFTFPGRWESLESRPNHLESLSSRRAGESRVKLRVVPLFVPLEGFHLNQLPQESVFLLLAAWGLETWGQFA